MIDKGCAKVIPRLIEFSKLRIIPFISSDIEGKYFMNISNFLIFCSELDVFIITTHSENVIITTIKELIVNNYLIKLYTVNNLLGWVFAENLRMRILI